MIIEDFAIPSAVFLSLIVLKTRYERLHYVAIGCCIVGISLGFLNDFMFAEPNDTPEQAARPLLGDFLALCGAFLYALENILQELLIKKSQDVFNFLGFIGFFGVILTLIFGSLHGEFSQF